MALAAAGRIRMNMCTSLVCIDEYNEQQFSGRIYHMYFGEQDNINKREAFGRKEGRIFRNLPELIEIHEELYDQFDFPQSNVIFRSLTDIERKTKSLKTDRKSNEAGKIATMTLRVMFRQNASWQGTVTWIEQNKTENFRSVLELIHLLNGLKTVEQPGEKEKIDRETKVRQNVS